MNPYRLIQSRIVLVLALFLQPPAPPPFSVSWTGNHSIRLSWTQPEAVALTCLHRGSTLIQCYRDLPPGATSTTLGNSAPLDASAHPAPGDTYTLTFDGTKAQARLGWALWVPRIVKG